MHRLIYSAFTFVFLLLPALKNFAATKVQEPITLTLDQVLKLTLRNSPEIKKLDATLADKLATATEVQIPGNPELEIERRVSENKTEIQLTQPFRLSHFGMRQAYAAALKQTANLEQQADILRVLNETILLYYRLWMLQKREAILVDSEKQAKEVITRIVEAVEKQETPATEGNLFKAEAIRFGVELKTTQVEQMQVQADLLQAIGVSWKKVSLTAPQLKSIPNDSFKLTQFALGRANLQQLIEQRQRLAARRYDVARMDIFPELSLRGIYDRGEDKEGWGVGIVARIPLWDWNQAEIKRSKVEKIVAEAEVQSLNRITLDRIIEIRMKRAIALQERAEAYWNVVLPAYRKSYELSRYMFEQGQVSMLQLWQVQQKIVEASGTALQVTVDALLARTLLEQAIGGKIEEVEK